MLIYGLTKLYSNPSSQGVVIGSKFKLILCEYVTLLCNNHQQFYDILESFHMFHYNWQVVLECQYIHLLRTFMLLEHKVHLQFFYKIHNHIPNPRLCIHMHQGIVLYHDPFN